MIQLTIGELHLGSTIVSQVDEIFLDVAAIINIFQVLPERVQDPVVTGMQLHTRRNSQMKYTASADVKQFLQQSLDAGKHLP